MYLYCQEYVVVTISISVAVTFEAFIVTVNSSPKLAVPPKFSVASDAPAHDIELNQEFCTTKKDDPEIVNVDLSEDPSSESALQFPSHVPFRLTWFPDSPVTVRDVEELCFVPTIVSSHSQ